MIRNNQLFLATMCGILNQIDTYRYTNTILQRNAVNRRMTAKCNSN